MTKRRICAWLVLALLLAGGCNLRAPEPLPPLDVSQSVIATLTAAPQLLSSPSPTPVVVLASVPNRAVERAPEQTALPALPSPMPDPLRFTFPTVESAPESLWRPPLYPTPWEPSPYDHFYFIRPIGANEINSPLERYRYGYLLYAEPHTGIDIPAPKGTPVLAAGPGTVIWAGYGIYFMQDEYKDPYGIAVAIKHDFGYNGKVLYTVYGHLDQTYAYRGQRVEGGQEIGVVGETGKVSGPHLHFEVRVGDNSFFVSRNPELWISPPQGRGVLVGRIIDGRGKHAQKVTVKLRSLEGKGNHDVITYAEGAVNSDDYYDENFVLGDLPEGEYTIIFDLESVSIKSQVTIRGGQVTFFSYTGRDGFVFTPPPTPGATFIPPDATETPLPTP